MAILSRQIYSGQTPKYILNAKDDFDGLYKSSDLFKLPEHCTSSVFDVCVVEDAVSAIRVGRVTPAVALLGTSVGQTLHGLYAYAVEIAQHGTAPKIAVWLDGDKAGHKGRDAIARKLSLAGAEVTKINTPLDPKRYSNREIKEILESGA
jgi:DNA primase